MIIGPPPKFHGTWDILAASRDLLSSGRLLDLLKMRPPIN